PTACKPLWLKRSEAPSPTPRCPAWERLEVDGSRQEHLPRVAVEGRRNAGPSKHRGRVAVGEYGRAGERGRGPVILPADNVFLVGQVLGVDAELVAIAAGPPNQVRVPQSIGRLIDVRDGELELLGSAPVGDRGVRVERSTRQRGAVIERAAQGPLGRVLDLAVCGNVRRTTACHLRDELRIFAVKVTERPCQGQAIPRGCEV